MANDTKPVDIKVKTTSEGTGVLGQISGFLAKIKEGGGAASKAIEGVAGIIRGPLAAASAVIASLAGAFATLTKAVGEYASAQEKVAKLDAALAQRGLLSGEFRERLQELAGELQATTAVADDEWLEVLRRLVQFGSTPESIGMDVEAVKNLAGIVGDVSTAANLYSRALQGNYDMFGRYGIAVRDAGTQTDKLRELQEQLARRGAGQLEAQARSLNGQWAQLKNTTSDLLEALGGAIARTGIIQGVLGVLTNVTSAWAEILGGTVEQLDGLTNQTGDAERALAAYRSQMEAVAKLSEAIIKSTKAETEAIRSKQRAIDEVADAQMALDLAQVDEAEASGKISKRGAIRARSGIRSAAARAKYDRDQAADLATLAVQQRAASDLGTQLADVRRRRATLEEELRVGGPRETAARIANERAEAIRREIEAVDRINSPEAAAMAGGMVVGATSEAWKSTRKRELWAQWAIAKRLGPVTLTGQRAELAAIREQEAGLVPKVEEARAAVAGSPIHAQMATRETVFGLNARRDAIGTGMAVSAAGADEAKRQLEAIQRGAAGVGQQVGGALESVERALGRTASVVGQFQKRLDAIEAAQRNALNR